MRYEFGAPHVHKVQMPPKRITSDVFEEDIKRQIRRLEDSLTSFSIRFSFLLDKKIKHLNS
jgi:hypothetical protein